MRLATTNGEDEAVQIWGTGAFDNDAAMRWVESLEHADEMILEETLDTVLEAEAQGDEPSPAEAAHAIAAAETVAAFGKRPAELLPEEVRQFCFDNPGFDLDEAQPKAMQALGVVLSASGLRDLIEDRGDADDWESELEELRDRLRAD
ncbi:MAG: DUF4259 domain-containing protein [Myxococcales bacterium]|nr:DUF4259 domain-containing protein [Myxococcales bacterium]